MYSLSYLIIFWMGEIFLQDHVNIILTIYIHFTFLAQFWSGLSDVLLQWSVFNLIPYLCLSWVTFLGIYNSIVNNIIGMHKPPFHYKIYPWMGFLKYCGLFFTVDTVNIIYSRFYDLRLRKNGSLVKLHVGMKICKNVFIALENIIAFCRGSVESWSLR